MICKSGLLFHSHLCAWPQLGIDERCSHGWSYWFQLLCPRCSLASARRLCGCNLGIPCTDSRATHTWLDLITRVFDKMGIVSSQIESFHSTHPPLIANVAGIQPVIHRYQSPGGQNWLAPPLFIVIKFLHGIFVVPFVRACHRFQGCYTWVDLLDTNLSE